MEMDLLGTLRIELSTDMLMNMTTGETRLVPMLRVKRQNHAGRWVKALPGPLMAVIGIEQPSRADLLEALARVLRTHDEEKP
jgi:hypothetical protein